MEERQLLIEINESRMTASVLSGGELAVIVEKPCTSRSDAGYKQTLQELINECGSTEEFTSYSCSWSSPKNTLVPMMLFPSTKPEKLLQLALHEAIPRGEHDYNRLPEWNMVNVYYMPLWIKSVLIHKTPRIVIQHEMSHLLRFLNTGSTIPQKTVIVLQENHFSCIIRKDGQIVHASMQEYQAPEDILYHLLYCFQAMNIDSKGDIFIYGTTESLREKAAIVQNQLKHVQAMATQKVTLSGADHLKFQSLCV